MYHFVVNDMVHKPRVTLSCGGSASGLMLSQYCGPEHIYCKSDSPT